MILRTQYLQLQRQQMGQSPAINWKEQLNIENKQWQQIKFQPNRRILQNVRTNIEAEYQVIQIDPQHTVEHQMEIYYYRKHQQNALVAVYGAGHVKDTSAPLCGNTETMKVLYQRIPRRLYELPQLILPEALYFLSEALRGYKDCYEKVGFFEVTDSMMGVNTDGEVRVWVNQNFALNHPETEKPILQITSTNQYREAAHLEEKAMLDNILKVIENKTEQGRFPEDFKARIYKQDSFVDAYCQIENYINGKNLWIPDRLPSNSLLIENRRQQSKIADFSSYLQQKSESNQISSTLQPHATYIPNVQYSYPRVTYIQSPYSPHSSNSDHVRPRTVQIQFPKSPQYNGRQTFNTQFTNNTYKPQYRSIESQGVALKQNLPQNSVAKLKEISQIHHLHHRPQQNYEPLKIKPYPHRF